MWSWQFASLKKQKPLGYGLDVGVNVQLKEVKVSSYIAQYPILRIAQSFTLYFPGSPIQSDTISTSLGSMQPYAAINARRLLAHTSITRLLPGIHLYS